jgi:uncharacterized OsmC-like protein
VTSVRHIARAVGSTGLTTPAYRVDVRVGDHRLTADEPAAAGGGDLGPSPFGLLLSGLAVTLAIRAGTPIGTTFLPRNP